MCSLPAHPNRWRRLDLLFIFICSCPLTFALGYFVWPLWGSLVCTGAAVAVAFVAVLKISSLKEGQVLERGTHSAFCFSIIFVYLSPMIYQV
jgi:hypothetical protein